MADGSTLVVRPNSIITVRDNASDDDGKKTNVHVVVDSGQMFVRTEQQPEGTTNVVETPKTKNKLGQQTGASFGVNPEGTEEIRVNTGAIETTDRSGEKISLNGGEYVSVNPSGTVSDRRNFWSVPLPSEPRDLRQGVRRSKWFRKYCVEMVATTVWFSGILSRRSGNFAFLRCRW